LIIDPLSDFCVEIIKVIFHKNRFFWLRLLCLVCICCVLNGLLFGQPDSMLCVEPHWHHRVIGCHSMSFHHLAIQRDQLDLDFALYGVEFGC
jgi:hypothetical protein